jgi:tyrosyl-tRNA synthetase
VSILEELKWRGLIADCTDAAELEKKISSPITLYSGFDPTADSLHVGHLVPLLALRRFQLLGHFPIALAGGATGSIGDPSWKASERPLLTKEVLERNVAAIKIQLAKLLDFETKQNPARLMDNASWMQNISYLDFLRDVGKHFSVNQMVAKESIRARMEDREAGISYAEFSYPLIQAFDFHLLSRDYNCELQIGGSDQWGNITSGIDLCRKKLSKTVFGLTLPLITKADGTKFGKTESGAIWLDPQKTSIYRFYQFWINTADADVIRYLKFFTLQRSKEEIAVLVEKHQKNPEAREAHRALAAEMTYLIHGEDALHRARIASAVLFGEGGDILDSRINFFEDIDGEVPTKEIEKSKLGGDGMPLIELVVQTGLCPSKGQARKDIEAGGIYVNNNRERELHRTITAKDLIHGHVLLRKGKKNYVSVTAK